MKRFIVAAVVFCVVLLIALIWLIWYYRPTFESAR